MRKKIRQCQLFFVLLLLISLQVNVVAKSVNQYYDDKKDISTQKKEIEGELEKNYNQSSSLNDRIEELDKELDKYSEELQEYETEIKNQEFLINKTDEKLELAKVKLDQQKATLNKRIKYMYENGTSGYLEIILKAQSLSDVFSRMDDVKAVIQYDQKVMSSLKETKKVIEKEQQNLNDYKASLVQSKEQVVKLEAVTLETRTQKNRELESVQFDITKKKESIEQLEKEEARIQQIIKKLEEEARRKKYEGGKLLWPLANYTRISSPFGWRNDPFTGERWFHNGVDIPAPRGTPVRAANDGKVILAEYNGGYGNLVMIDHGGLVTMYGHNSKILVKKGQWVKRGDIVAQVGSTGRSTGNHCHFEVRVNNKKVDPFTYIGK